MCSDAVGAGVGGHVAGVDRIGMTATPRISDGGHMINVYAQS